MSDRQFDSSSHALRTGLLVGHLIAQGVKVRPVMNGTDYSATLRIEIPNDDYGYTSTTVEVQVLPPEVTP